MLLNFDSFRKLGNCVRYGNRAFVVCVVLSVCNAALHWQHTGSLSSPIDLSLLVSRGRTLNRREHGDLVVNS